MNKTMQAFHNTYNQLFFDASEAFVPASDFDSYDLADWGLTTIPLAARLACIDDLSPCEFDTQAEFIRAKAQIIEKETAAKIIAGDTMLAKLVNYKGEFEKMEIVDVAKTLPIFVSKEASFAHFGV